MRTCPCLMGSGDPNSPQEGELVQRPAPRPKRAQVGTPETIKATLQEGLTTAGGSVTRGPKGSPASPAEDLPSAVSLSKWAPHWW